MAIYEHTYTVEMRDIGTTCEVTNRAILNFFEEIGCLHSDQVGYGLANIEQTKLSWVLLHLKATILKRPKYGDSLLIKTWARESFKFFCFRDYEIYDAQTKERVAYGTSKWTLIHLEKGLAKIDDTIMDVYEAETKHTYPEELLKLKEPNTEKIIRQIQYPVLRSHIDINQHMNNLFYLDAAYETLPLDLYQSCAFNHIEIMYKKEAKLGENLVCSYTEVDAEHIITIKSEDEKILHAIVKLS